MATFAPISRHLSPPESPAEDSSGSDGSPLRAAKRFVAIGDGNLRKRLRNRYSSAKFRERQRLRVNELREHIAHFELENRHLELRIQQLLSCAFQDEGLSVGTAQTCSPPSMVPLVEVLSDEELLSAIQSCFSG